MTIIKATNGPHILVDRDVYDWAHWINWHVTGHGYAVVHLPGTGKRGKKVYLHQLLLPKETGLEIDHINRNRLDNRRRNLRYATKSENIHNARLKSNNRSGFKGVYWDQQTGRWRAQIKINGKTHTLGRFLNSHEAAETLQEWCRTHVPKLIR